MAAVDAREIYQDFLDTVSRALMAGDVPAIVARMVFPQELRTLDGFLTVTRPDEMCDIVNDFRAWLMEIGTSDYHRICERAEVDVSGQTITGEHMTYVIRGGSFAIAPIRSAMILRRVEGEWFGAGNRAATTNRAFTILSPRQLRARGEPRP